MHTLFKKNEFRKGISFLLIVCIMTGILSCLNIRIAKADWLTFDDLPNGIQSAEVYKTTVVQTGKHHSADDNIPRYLTQGYYMTMDTYDLTEYFDSGSNASIENHFIPMKITREWEGTDDIKWTEYTIQKEDFMTALTDEFDITGEQLKDKKTITVYMNNIFDVVKGKNDSVIYNNVYGYQEMMDKESWSSDTKEYLKGYYNFPYKLTPVLYDIEYVAVDKNFKPLDGAKNANGQIISDPLSSNKVIFTEKVNYPMPEANTTLVLNNVTYNYEKWYYTYTPYGGGDEIKRGPSVKDVSFKAPDAMKDKTLTVYLVYEPVKTQYSVKTIAETTGGTTIKKLRDAETVTSGNKYTEQVPGLIQEADGIKYTIQNKCYLEYEKNDDTKTIIKRDVPLENNNGYYSISEYVLPEAKANSLATFHVIYDKKTVTPTPKPSGTVTPTPKPTGIATPTPKPTGTTTPTPMPTATPTSQPDPTVAPEPAESSDLTTPFTTGQIRADNRGSEQFTVTSGIPTTESLFGQVTAKEYLLGYRFIKRTGEITYSVKVTKNYILNWKSATPTKAGGGKPQSETVPVTQYISVTRAYGYWEIENLDYYNINKATLYNYALPDGKLILKPRNSYYNPPSINYYHTTDTSYHIIPPSEVINGIVLDTETITGGTTKPTVPIRDFLYEAVTRTGKISVRNDSLSFNGKTVLNNSVTAKEAPHAILSNLPQCTTYTDQNALYDNDQVIKATKFNGEYGSSGVIEYRAVAKVGSTNSDNLSSSISGINDVIIHTPVLCDPVIIADNDKYVQLVNPTKGAVELVLDPDQTYSDFTITISNTGFHTGIAGFFTRDFSKSLHDGVASYIEEVGGILRNEVKFPFDIFVDKGNDKKTENDDYIKAGTWLTLGRNTVRFYLPTWAGEGVYTVDFRTVAVNVGDHTRDTENFANRDRRNYVATNTRKFEISGRIYGLTLYDISDYPMWKEAFRIPKSSILKKNSSLYPDGTWKETYNKNYSYTYTVGTNNQYGKDTGRKNKYTLPLVNGSHPYYKNQGILKTGYLIRFSLDTIGDMFSDDTTVVLKPSFYFVDKEGKNRTAIDLYYTENINGKTENLVKVGGARDKTNIKYYHTGDLNLGIPKTEMKQTATLRKQEYGNFYWQNSAMFTFSKIQLNYAFRTLIGHHYAEGIKKLDSFAIVQKSISESDVEKTMQRWYGQYYIPNDIHIVKKGYDVMDYAKKHGVRYTEDFWLKDGYIIINMNIYTVKDGKQHLSYVNADNYINNGNCSMWITEGPVLSKESYKGPTFGFYAGDLFIYYGNMKMSDDYSTKAIY